MLVTDGFMVLVLLRLRSRNPSATFRVPLYPALPLLFLAVYVLLLLGALWQQPARRCCRSPCSVWSASSPAPWSRGRSRGPSPA